MLPHPESSSPNAPIGAAVTRVFLFTDIEGSTELWERTDADFRNALDLHDALIRSAIERCGGIELHEAGDGFLIAFTEPRAALDCAKSLQRDFAEASWPGKVAAIRVRMSLQIGQVEQRDGGEFRGVVINRGARVLGTAHGGQIVCTNAFATVMKGAAEFEELGTFRLRGLAAPERIFQVCWPEMPRREFPALRAQPAFTSNLPASYTRFFGRTNEIARVRGMIVENLSREPQPGRRVGTLVTLTGPGGTGKTRLSLAVAESVLAEFSHAVFFVALADLLDAKLLAPTVRDALRIKPEPSLDAFEQIVEWLAAQPALLVFDNFEQLGQEGAGFMHKLLTQLPMLACIVTSRQRLNLPGEREFSVPPMSAPASAANADPEQLLQFESVQLYVDRAMTVRSSFALTTRNASAVAELCAKLEGIPLAIELAAAKADVATPQETVRALDARLDALGSDQLGLPARHRTLRAAIDWSYDFLPEALQRFFANLAVFRGGWTAEAAGAIAAPEGLEGVSANVLRALSELRSASLISAEETDDGMRFRMLETIRQYAEDRLKRSLEEEPTSTRHRGFFLALAERGETELLTAAQEEWLAKLEVEHDNFRAVFTRWSTSVDALRTAVALARFWMIRGHHAEGRLWLKRLGEHVTDASELQRAWLASAVGILSMSSGDLPAAREAFERTLEFYRRENDPRNVAGMLSNLAIVLRQSGDFDAARRYLSESVEMYRALKMETQLAQALTNLGGVALSQKDSEAAKAALEESVPILRRIGDHASLAVTLQNLAMTLALHGQLAGAKAMMNESFALVSRLKFCRAAASSFHAKARLAIYSRNLIEAARMLEAARFAAEVFGTPLQSEAMEEFETVRSQADDMLLETATREAPSLVRKWFPVSTATLEFH